MIECKDCEGKGYCDNYCDSCSGSGEGPADGTRCGTCKGSGNRQYECQSCEGKGEISEEAYRDSILDILADGWSVVTFTKADGSTRIMESTIDADFIPDEHLPKGDGKYSADVIRVYTPDGWRSFKIDSLEDITPKA